MGPRAVLDGVENLVPPPPGFDPTTVQPVANRYTVYAIPAHNNFSFICFGCDSPPPSGPGPPHSRGF